MSSKVRRLEDLDRCGNSVSLDFVNTVHSRFDPRPHEYLRRYRDLLQWSRCGGLIDGAEEKDLQALARTRREGAERALEKALALREALYRLFQDVRGGGSPSPSELKSLDQWCRRALSQRRLEWAGGGLRWSWPNRGRHLDGLIWPVALDAARLLEEEDLRRLRQCPSPHGCGWLFLDISKNGRRRWCDMRQCGNLAKSRRFADRRRIQSGTTRAQESVRQERRGDKGNGKDPA